MLDGNVKRVLVRLFNISACIDNAPTQERLWSLAEALAPVKSPGDFNQAMMELGARVCAPRQPCCAGCPVRRYCQALAAGTQAHLPIRRPKKTTPHYDLVVAVIRKNGRYLLGRRPRGGLLGGLWEFPAGDVKAGETHRQALAREARRLGLRLGPGGFVSVVSHAYSHFQVTLHVYRCPYIAGTPHRGAYDGLKWILPRDLSRYPLPKANHKFLPLLDVT